jgi:hypothetical protein
LREELQRLEEEGNMLHEELEKIVNENVIKLEDFKNEQVFYF